MSTSNPHILITRAIVWADGCTPCPWLILIHPRAASDGGLRAHEMVHVDQMRRDGLLRFWGRYAFSKAWRLVYEVEAYRVSVAHDNNPEHYARLLASGYRLDITQAQAVELLIAKDSAA